MRLKPILFIIGVLIFAQIMFYGNAQRGNVEIVNHEIIEVKGMIRELKSEEMSLNHKHKELTEFVEAIPSSLLTGFTDPEVGFMEYLDYLQSPIMEKVDNEILLKTVQKFKAQPVPLHESNFNFKFSFANTGEAEKYFDYLLNQKEHPVQVKTIKISRKKEGGKTQGEINLNLLIPAKLQHPAIALKSLEAK